MIKNGEISEKLWKSFKKPKTSKMEEYEENRSRYWNSDENFEI